MTQHLTSDQFASSMAGESSADERRHIAECVHCREEIERLRSTLAVFGDSVRKWGDAHGAARTSFELARPRTFAAGRLRVALAIVAMLVIAVVPLTRHMVDQRRAAEAARQDGLLMQRIDDELSQTVPEQMEPLLKLTTGSDSEPQQSSGGSR